MKCKQTIKRFIIQDIPKKVYILCIISAKSIMTYAQYVSELL